MTATHPLRHLTPDAVTELLRSRPELLEVQPPGSLRELWARLCHPPLIRRALERLDLPTLHVVEVLAAFGDPGDPTRSRAQVAEILGVAEAAARAATLERALATLRAHVLIDPGDPDSHRLVPGARQLWAAPLGLGPDLRSLAEGCSAEELRAVLVTVQERPPARKAEMIHRVVSVLGDGDRVRGLMLDCPQELLDPLLEVAHGRALIEYHGWYSPRVARTRGVVHNPMEWAIDRFLLVRRDWQTTLEMPAEVAMALRGAAWRAPLATEPPPVTWHSLPERSVADAAVAAASSSIRMMTTLLTAAGTRPVPLLKSGAVGVRELRRLAQAIGSSPAEVRLYLELARQLRLISFIDEGLAPTAAFDDWARLPVADRYAQVLTAWLALAEVPLSTADAAWGGYEEAVPVEGPGHGVRRAVLALLAEHPQAAPESPAQFTHLVRWSAPLLLGPAPGKHSTASDDAEQDSTVDGVIDDAQRLVSAVLTEAARLGVTGVDALSPAGAALLTGGDVAAAIGTALGSARTTALLGSDLTAVVLGEPDPALAEALDRMADRENRSTAGVWRFSPASVRRAMDAGADAASVLGELEALAEGAVPQPLIYLVRDVARRHGRLRAGSVACYLRSDDVALLSELVHDRTVRRLGLYQVAPTVLVGALPLPETLDALRRAGHAPVQEAPDGATIVRSERRHRAQPLDDAPASGSPHPAGPTSDGRDALAALAAQLIAAPDETEGLLVQIGSTVVAVRPQARPRHTATEPLWS